MSQSTSLQHLKKKTLEKNYYRESGLRSTQESKAFLSSQKVKSFEERTYYFWFLCLGRAIGETQKEEEKNLPDYFSYGNDALSLTSCFLPWRTWTKISAAMSRMNT